MEKVNGAPSMTAEERFLKALKSGASHDALRSMGEDIEKVEGPFAWAECIDRWISTLGDEESSNTAAEGLYSLRAEALERAALADPKNAGNFYVPAYKIYDALNHADEAKRIGVAAILATSGNEEELKELIVEMGGKDHVLGCLQWELKKPEVKKERLYSAVCRQHLALTYKSYGDVSRAFFEMLKAFRKKPKDNSILDEMFSLALASEHADELVLVLLDLTDDEELTPKKRATLCNKAAHLQEKTLGQLEEALATYEKAHSLNPAIKGPIKNIERIKKKRGASQSGNKKQTKKTKTKKPSKKKARSLEQEIPFLQNDSLKSEGENVQVDAELLLDSRSGHADTTEVSDIPDELFRSDDDSVNAVFTQEAVTDEHYSLRARASEQLNTELVPTSNETHPFLSRPDDDAGSVFTQEQKETHLTPSDIEKIEKNLIPVVDDTGDARDDVSASSPHAPEGNEQASSIGAREVLSNSAKPESGFDEEPPPLPPDSDAEQEPSKRNDRQFDDNDAPPPLPFETQFPTVAEFDDEKTDILDLRNEDDTDDGDPTRLMSVNDISEMTDIEKSDEEPPSFIEEHGQVEIIEDTNVEAARAAVFLSAHGQGGKAAGETNTPRSESGVFDERTDDAISPFAEHSLPSGHVDFAASAKKPLIVTDSDFEEDSIHSRIDAALEAENAEACKTLLNAEHSKLDPEMKIRLLERTLMAEAETGVIDAALLKHLVNVQIAKPEKSVDLAIRLKAKMPLDSVDDYMEIWLTLARSAKHWEQVETLLEDFAILHAPDGEPFLTLDKRLEKDGQLENRFQLREQAIKRAVNDNKRFQMMRETIGLYQEHQQGERAVGLYRNLILEHQQADRELVTDALECFETYSNKEETARFLFQLLKSAPEHEHALDYYKKLIELRLETNDALGAEAAARDLLAKHPGDSFALEVLSEVLANIPSRRKELIDILEMRRSISRNRKEISSFRQLTLEVAAHWRAEGKEARVLDVLMASIQAFPADDEAVSQVVEIYQRGKRFREWIAFLVDIAERHSEASQQIRYFSEAARVATRELKKTGRAKELLERALDVDPDHEDALTAKAELAIELGDGADAVHALERLLAQNKEPSERSNYHLKIGQILEEKLLKPEEALKRYLAATGENEENVQAWRFLVALSRLQDDHDKLLDGLNHLQRLSAIDAERAIYLKELGVIYRDEKGDSTGAEEAFANALQCSPLDEELLFDLLDLIAGRLEESIRSRELERHPGEAYLEEIQRPLFWVLNAKQEKAEPSSFAFELLVALHYGSFGESRTAREWFEKLYSLNPEHCALLQGYSAFLATADFGQERRKECLEKLLLHHAPSLNRFEQIALWADVATLRWRSDEESSGRKAIKMALALAAEDSEKEWISDEAITVAIEALDVEDGGSEEDRLILVALQIAASRAAGEAAAEFYNKAADLATLKLNDIPFARRLLILALEQSPDDYQARDRLIELELKDGDGEQAIASRFVLLAGEDDSAKKAEHHIAIGRLVIKVHDDVKEATEHYLEAMTFAPENPSAHTELEDLYRRKDRLSDLETIYTRHLKAQDADAVRIRVLLFQRLAQLRRYELRDYKGAIEALEAIVSLMPNELKAREDAARLYADTGHQQKAIEAWRGVLEREPVSKEAWRSIYSLYGLQGLGDHAYRVAETMSTIEIADKELSALIRKVRPPFPCWPKRKSANSKVEPRLSHALAQTPLKNVMKIVGPLLQPAYAQPLKAYGLSRRKALAEHEIPSSLMIALRTGTELLGLKQPPKLFPMKSAQGLESNAEFALLPASEPGILVSQEVLTGGMTPTRAFSLGRLMIWLTPQALLSNCVDPAQLQMIVNTLCKHFLPPLKGEGWDPILPHGGKELEKVLFQGLGTSEKSARWHKIVDALERYAPTRKHVHVSDWLAGIGYTGDRFGFFLSGDLTAGVRILQESTDKKMGARLAIKELVLYSVSESFFRLREDFELKLPKEQSELFLSN